MCLVGRSSDLLTNSSMHIDIQGKKSWFCTQYRIGLQKNDISQPSSRKTGSETKIFDVSRQVPFHRSHKLTTALLKISRTTLSVFQEVRIKLNSFETILK